MLYRRRIDTIAATDILPLHVAEYARSTLRMR
jgi:hypothetical protein